MPLRMVMGGGQNAASVGNKGAWQFVAGNYMTYVFLQGASNAGGVGTVTYKWRTPAALTSSAVATLSNPTGFSHAMALTKGFGTYDGDGPSFTINASVSSQWHGPVPVAAGQALFICCDTANIAFILALHAYEQRGESGMLLGPYL